VPSSSRLIFPSGDDHIRDRLVCNQRTTFAARLKACPFKTLVPDVSVEHRSLDYEDRLRGGRSSSLGMTVLFSFQLATSKTGVAKLQSTVTVAQQPAFP